MFNNNALKAIRAKCIDCSAGSQHEVRVCPITDCPLWPFRMGKRPSTLAKKRPELLEVSEHPSGVQSDENAVEVGISAPE